jgi:hypothetical protein
MSLFLAALSALTLQTAPDPAEAEIAAVSAAVEATLSWSSTAAYFALFTPDARFIGTDATERWSLDGLRAFTEPYFSRGQGWTYTPRNRVITLAPIECRCIAWFDEELDNPDYGQTRGSGVLRKTADGWKIEQYVLSFAVPNDKAGAVVEEIRGD